jgi:hypothetical protein
MTAFINEAGKIYGKTYKWRVLTYERGGKWACECINCGAKRLVRSVDLRDGRYPACRNCCRVCGGTRADTTFTTGFSKVCKTCQSKRLKQWRIKTGFKAKKRAWDITNSKKRRNYQLRAESRIQSSPYEFLTALLRARRTSKTWPVSINDKFLHEMWDQQHGCCAITKLSMAHNRNNLRTVSIDRIDQSRGYAADNVQLVCRWVNFAKNSATDVEIRQILTEFKSCD